MKTKYAELDAALTGRNSQRRKLANNTYAERRDNGSIAIRLHDTDIITLHKDGSLTVTSGGWKTSTTKARLNDYLPHGFGLYASGGIWHWTQRNGTFEKLGIFSDGDTISPGGKLTNTGKAGRGKDSVSISQARQQVRGSLRRCLSIA